jgi:hypothetical protein
MRLRVVSAEVVPPDCVQVTIVPHRDHNSSVIVLPYWLADYLKIVAGDVISICREDRNVGPLQGFRLFLADDAN